MKLILKGNTADAEIKMFQMKPHSKLVTVFVLVHVLNDK